jgi:hypothetical protein
MLHANLDHVQGMFYLLHALSRLTDLANFSCFGTLIREINLVSDLNKTWKDIKIQ